MNFNDSALLIKKMAKTPGRPQACRSSTVAQTRLPDVRNAGWLDRMTFFKNLFSRIPRRARAIRAAVDRGMSTAEYAVGTVAAVAFAVVLYKIVRSSAVSSTLSNIITTALHAI